MASGRANQQREERLRLEAAEWFARLRAPDGEKDRVSFDAWYAADPAHQEAFDRIERRWEQTAFLANTELGRSRGLETVAPSQGRRWRYGAAAAAAVALIVTAVVWHGSAVQTRPGVEKIHYATHRGQFRTIKLPDGSTATLDAHSLLTRSYSRHVRRLTLAKGRARFSVAHEDNREFQVIAGFALVVAHGTVFDVSVGHGDNVQVALLSGSVEVMPRHVATGGAARRRGRKLVPGQQVILSAEKPIPAPTPAPAAQMRWVSGMLSFDGAKLTDAIAELNRYGRRKMRIADPGLADLRVTGAFRAADAEEFADTVAAAFDLRVERMPNGTLLIERAADEGP